MNNVWKTNSQLQMLITNGSMKQQMNVSTKTRYLNIEIKKNVVFHAMNKGNRIRAALE